MNTTANKTAGLRNPTLLLGLALVPLVWPGVADVSSAAGSGAIYVAQDFDFPDVLEFTLPTAFGSGYIHDEAAGINAYFEFKGIVGSWHRYTVTGTLACDCATGQVWFELEMPPSP